MCGRAQMGEWHPKAVSAMIGEWRAQKESLSNHYLDGTCPYKGENSSGARKSECMTHNMTGYIVAVPY